MSLLMKIDFTPDQLRRLTVIRSLRTAFPRIVF